MSGVVRVRGKFNGWAWICEKCSAPVVNDMNCSVCQSSMFEVTAIEHVYIPLGVVFLHDERIEQ